jgi:hypothetical protein
MRRWLMGKGRFPSSPGGDGGSEDSDDSGSEDSEDGGSESNSESDDDLADEDGAPPEYSRRGENQ